MNRHKYQYVFLFILWASIVYPGNIVQGQNSALPEAFLIGEYEHEYESLGLSCNQMLLSVCKDSMEHAYRIWLTMLVDIESFASKEGFEINGIKIWINVYWNADGTIRHIAYYPKPSSKNMNFNDLSLFFIKFIKDYKVPLTSPQCFSHNGSASFPSHAELYLKRKN